MTTRDPYLQYAEVLSEISEIENKLSNKQRLLEDLRQDLIDKNDPSICIIITDHAYRQASERLDVLSRESTQIFKDVVSPENQSKSLLRPSNIQAFLIGMIAQAHSAKKVSEAESKSGNGVEYRYNIEIKKWSTNEKKLFFIGIVENSVIKTCYFNWTNQ